MKIHICDKCHENLEETRIICRGIVVIIAGKLEVEILEHEFCSIYCMNQYIIERLQEKGIGDNIKV